jgi:hypothetical protein
MVSAAAKARQRGATAATAAEPRIELQQQQSPQKSAALDAAASLAAASNLASAAGRARQRATIVSNSVRTPPTTAAGVSAPVAVSTTSPGQVDPEDLVSAAPVPPTRRRMQTVEEDMAIDMDDL